LVAAFLFEGYLFGNLADVKDNFSLVMLGIILVSLLPVLSLIKSKRNPKMLAKVRTWSIS
jgi:membrane-associated protein